MALQKSIFLWSDVGTLCLIFVSSGRYDESDDVDSWLGWQAYTASHSQAQAFVDRKTDLQYDHSWKCEHDPHTQYPSRWWRQWTIQAHLPWRHQGIYNVLHKMWQKCVSNELWSRYLEQTVTLLKEIVYTCSPICVLLGCLFGICLHMYIIVWIRSTYKICAISVNEKTPSWLSFSFLKICSKNWLTEPWPGEICYLWFSLIFIIKR